MDEYIGSIELYAFDFAPYGWVLCNGATLQINSNQALFALIGKTYGGDGVTTFNLPNLRGFEPVPNMQYYIAVQGYFPSRS
ncbi:tail fiber protein [Paludibacter sp.]|uniref:phage tail protein n=1 Tax=Paludibacter sp. TaxID=1898105 RepID=UPI001352B4E1|nr:tail fiber protein [Paludibacter sp.]MTK53597.1 tail fiber protein [Paludibacter sp.]